MIHGTDKAGTTRAVRPADADHVLHARIRAEYREMPRMGLTLRQAARLFDLEPVQCARVLDTLVSHGVLWTNGRECFGSNVARQCA